MKNEPFDVSDESFVVAILDRHGSVRSEYDFLTLGIHVNIARAVKDAYIALHGKNSVETRRQAWRCIKRFSFFLSSEGLSQLDRLPSNTLSNYHRWLSEQDLNNSTRQSQLNIVIAVLCWIERNSRTALQPEFRLRVPHFIRSEPNILPSLDAKTVKNILAAAYSDIDTTIAKLELLSSSAEYLPETDECTQKILINELLRIGNGLIPAQKVINRSGNSLSRRVVAAGGIRAIRSKIFPIPEDIFSFYIAILAQTGGNPMAIQNLKRDALRDDILRSDRKRIVWEKLRSHSEQSADFGTRRPRSAPNLIEILLSLNASLVPFATASHKDKLFLAMTKQGDVQVPCYQLFHLMLDAFIVRHKLPKFDPKQLRKTAAVLHEQAGGIFLAKTRLNHKSIRTTFSYTKTDSLLDQNDRLILRFQGELVREAKSESSKTFTKPSVSIVREAHTYETVFGFLCKDPFSGVAPNSTVGKMCPSFTNCSTCPGAVVPLDNPEIVARLLNSRKALLSIRVKANLDGWLERYQELYEPTLQILETDLLPKVAPSVMMLAERIVVPQLPPNFE